ncbi:hypothetical protein KM043_009501 [Ampulex compressa]|nr:hypothetical protein KM043_009501 [Ampulex compressa]
MATDVEESDTDEHQRPAPPKRQRTRLVKLHETCLDTEKQPIEKEQLAQEIENGEYDDAEMHAREKLKRWQACQLAKGFVDNTINRVLENYIMGTHASYSSEDSRFCLFRGNDMENTAVMMAIRNHGLVQSAELVSQSHSFYDDKAPGYWTDNDYVDVQCSHSSDHMEGMGNFSRSMATTSAGSVRVNSSDAEQYNRLEWRADEVDDSDQQEDFLERAVAEAIKKKGLSALSVDYG